MKDKKGILLSTTLKVVIAVVCVVLLLIFGAKTYGMFQEESNLEKATKSLGEIHSAINKAELSGEREETWIYSPTSWSIVAWPYEEDFRRPIECSRDKYCICICDVNKIDLWITKIPLGKETFLDSCNKKGVCIDIEGDFVKTINKNNQNIPVEIENPPMRLYVEKFSGGYNLIEG